MRVPLKIGDKEFIVRPYRTHQEKDILLSSSFDVCDFNSIGEILGFETEHELSANEQRVILFKHREVSLGDEIDVKFTCPECGQGNDGVLGASEFVVPPERNDPGIRKIETPVTDENLQEFVPGREDVLDLDVQEFEALKDRVRRNQVQFNFTKTALCLKCRAPKTFDLSSLKYIIDVMSDDTLMTLYKSYNYLIFFGHYTKDGIDGMYPFERSIFIGLLSKTKKDLNQ